MAQAQRNLESLFDSLEIDPFFIQFDLKDLVEAASDVPLTQLPGLVKIAINRVHEREDLASVSPEEVEKAFRGESANDSAIIMPTTWRLAAPVRNQLIALLDISSEQVSKRAKLFREEILSNPVYKQEQSKNWNLRFVDYLMDTLLVSKESRAFTPRVDGSNYPEELAEENRQKISNVIAMLERKFSTKYLHTVPYSWAPSSGLAKHLQKLGVAREVIYDDRFVKPFMRKCQKEKIPYYQIDGRYRTYVLAHREMLKNLVQQVN